MSLAWAALLGACALSVAGPAPRPTTESRVAEELARRMDEMSKDLVELSRLQVSYPGRCPDPVLDEERSRWVGKLRLRTATLSDALHEYYALRERNDFIAMGLVATAARKRGARASGSTEKIARMFTRKDIGDQVRDFRDRVAAALEQEDRAYQRMQETCRMARRRKVWGAGLGLLALLLSGGLLLAWRRTARPLSPRP